MTHANRNIGFNMKLLDNTIKIPSYFTYIFHSKVLNQNNALAYKFLTHNDGKNLAKTPMNMFKEDYVDNDLRIIIARIDEYRAGIKPAEVKL